MKRGNGKKSRVKLLAVWVPKTLLPSLDKGVKEEDSNRSKFIRDAIREKLARQGGIIKAKTKK